MNDWIKKAVFYHIYPLGLCGAPRQNDFSSAPQDRICRLQEWAVHIRKCGFTALYLGPVFESGSHGYDTSDYFTVDRRLGTRESLAAACSAFKKEGIRIVFDAVFNHVGRDFWAFRDLREKGQASAYKSWFKSVDFSRASPCGDPFGYATWQGHSSLVKLDLANPEVKKHLFDAAGQWIRDYDIDGLRMDAADCMDKSFLGELAARCRALKPDFWVMGEVIHGNYADWANPRCIDSVTNYHAYKGLYSSFNDGNFFEIAFTLQQQSGAGGTCRHTPLYNFADNHDVNRIASTLLIGT